jgi:anti-sigma regulatory factor (Ser/Thr protein kinase)
MMMRRVFDATADAVPSARHAVTAFAEREGFRGAALHDIALALSEACTNVVLHAYRDELEPGTFAVEARLPAAGRRAAADRRARRVVRGLRRREERHDGRHALRDGGVGSAEWPNTFPEAPGRP